ncbi:pentatricopeptide repeat-containing protein At1g08070, chloroplastic-like [Nicotiana tomentosiformis]|uniref:pentatricopeptide repeat-containing protein At1g08070, chloroplastic-like n=1 Tax=Nicotiana tomentosiformis TaxID=4098 RepID=UPI00051ABE1A|nr:pentatricopeptide repeat-containing protein At1g08070, chloroplastic-like [Nicotiana tomentosiformis]
MNDSRNGLWQQKDIALSLLKSSHKLTTLNHLKSLHVYLLRTGLHHSSFAVGNFITYCASLGIMSYAAQLFDQMSEPNSFVWNTLIRGFQQNHSSKNTLYYFDQMRAHGVQPDKFTYPFVIRACSDLLEFAKGLSLHGQLFKIGVHFDIFVGTSLIEFYTAMGNMSMTKKVFEELPVKDEVTWYAMLSCYVNKFNDMEKARDLFEKIPCKDLVIWHTIILGYVKAGDLELAKWYFDRAPVKDLLMYNTILGCLAKNGELDCLLRLFHEMPFRDLVSWNTVIGGLVRDGRINEAMRFFHQMERVNLSPDDVTLASLLSACAQAGALDTGKWLHSYIDRRYNELNAVIGTALVDMYCKCGDLESAAYVFDKMPERDVVAWSAMIMGSSMNGQSRTALNFFYRMKDESERPNDATILGVLCACVHAGLVDEGRKCFYGMSQKFGLTPKLEHYGCMVDLLGRAGLLDEAYNLIQSMPYEPHTGAWGALLGACKIHGNVELAEKAIEHLIQLDLEDGGYLAIMSNIYANAGRWEDVSKVRKLMKVKGIGKSRGISSIEVNGVIHEFGVQEKRHPQAREIYDMIDEIYRRLKKAGHVASTSEVFFDVEEEEKEKALFFHSEKMAVAFGLIATDKNTIIRVVKNLRICADCHAAMKLISASFEREIIIRDRHRFHHFKNGFCSCGDYW